MRRLRGVLREFWGVWGGPGGSKGVCLTPIGHVLPLWKSCRALNLVPNPTKWSNRPMFTRFASLTHFMTFGAPLGAPKTPFYEQIKPLWNLRRSQNALHRVQNAVYYWLPPRWSILDKIWSLWAIWWPLQGLKGQIKDYLEPQIGLICS